MKSTSSSRIRPPDAYEKAVDRFLDDPAYGERWARMWLDQARYADSAGYGSDPLRPTSGGIATGSSTPSTATCRLTSSRSSRSPATCCPIRRSNERIATAFHRNTMTNTEGGTDDEEFRVAAIKDRVDTTMQVWMGLTMGCAKCHSHKFDPITHEEYYQVLRDLQSDRRQRSATESPVMRRPGFAIDRIDADRRCADTETHADCRAGKWESSWPRRSSQGLPKNPDDLDTADKRPSPGRAWRALPSSPELKPVRDKIAALEKSKPAIPNVPVMVELPPDRHRVTHILRKGNFLDPGDVVEPGVPQVAASASPTASPRIGSGWRGGWSIPGTR